MVINIDEPGIHGGRMGVVSTSRGTTVGIQTEYALQGEQSSLYLDASQWRVRAARLRFKWEAALTLTPSVDLHKQRINPRAVLAHPGETAIFF